MGPAMASSLLLLHGAGTASRARFALLRQALLSKGVSSCAFDFIGCGDSGGDMRHASLASRAEQARMVIDAQSLNAPMAILGASMGAHTAISLAAHYDVALLILVVPAVYSPRAEEIDFGPAFSRVIRQERSWLESNAWKTMAEYTGDLFIIAAENDAVIPGEIIQRLFECAARARHRRLLRIPDAPHQILSYLAETGAHWLEPITAHIAGRVDRLSGGAG